jgi:peroxiredoxin Q/BCP
VAYFAASVDTVEDNTKFAQSLDLDFPILSDPTKTVATAFGVVTAERKLAYRWTFYIDIDGKVLAIDKQVSPATAGKDLVAKLTELGMDKRKK